MTFADSALHEAHTNHWDVSLLEPRPWICLLDVNAGNADFGTTELTATPFFDTRTGSTTLSDRLNIAPIRHRIWPVLCVSMTDDALDVRPPFE